MAKEIKKEAQTQVVEAKKQKEKRNYFLEFFAKEYKGENLILLVLAIFAVVLGALIISGTLVVYEEFFLIGLKQGKVFAWILIALGSVSIILVAYPFYYPSFGEIKHIKGYTKVDYLKNTLSVLVFIVIVALVFFLYDLGLNPLMELIKGY